MSSGLGAGVQTNPDVFFSRNRKPIEKVLDVDFVIKVSSDHPLTPVLVSYFLIL